MGSIRTRPNECIQPPSAPQNRNDTNLFGPLQLYIWSYHVPASDGTANWQWIGNTNKSTPLPPFSPYTLNYGTKLKRHWKPFNSAMSCFKSTRNQEDNTFPRELLFNVNFSLWSTLPDDKTAVKSFSRLPSRAFGLYCVILTASHTQR